MPITPVEIRHLQLKRGLLGYGYSRAVVDRALVEIADSFEAVWRQRADLADRIEELEEEIKRHVELETLLRSTLVSAERAAQDVKEQARREAELIVTEAHTEARTVRRGDRRQGAPPPRHPPHPGTAAKRARRSGGRGGREPRAGAPAGAAPPPGAATTARAARARDPPPGGIAPPGEASHAGYPWGVERPGFRLRVRVAPGSSASGVVGRHGDGWKVWVNAPAERGRANEAVLGVLADALRAARRCTTAARRGGEGSSWRVAGITAAEAELRLSAAGGAS